MPPHLIYEMKGREDMAKSNNSGAQKVNTTKSSKRVSDSDMAAMVNRAAKSLKDFR